MSFSRQNIVLSVLWLNKQIHIEAKTKDFTPEDLFNFTVSFALSLQPFLRQDLRHLKFDLHPVSPQKFFAEDWASIKKRDLKATNKSLNLQQFTELKVHVVDWKSSESTSYDATSQERAFEEEINFLQHEKFFPVVVSTVASVLILFYQQQKKGPKYCPFVSADQPCGK